MPATAPLPTASLSQGLPRRLGSLSSTALASIAQAAPAHDGDGGEESEVMVYTLDDADDEDHGLLGELEYDEEEEEEEDDDDDNDNNDESLHYAEHHSCPIHHQQFLLHQSPYYQDMDAYLSDGLDTSDDAGAPLVDYVVSHLLTDDVDMDGPADPDGDADFSWTEDDGSNPESIISPDADMAADAQAAAMEAHTLAAAFASMAPPVTTDLFGHFGPGTAWAHPFSFSNPNPATIGPSNYALCDFLHHWARQSRILQGMARGSCPWPSRVNLLELSALTSVDYKELEGDQCDFQGVDWEDIGVTRSDARERRLLTYTNYVNIPGSDRWTPNLPDVALPRSESFFRVRRMDIRQDIHLSHFQLRNVFASTSRSRVFYPAIGAVQQFNPMSGHDRAVMNLSDAAHSQVSTLAADHGVLVAGSFGGEYIIRHLDSGEPENTASHEGAITSSASGITNHVAVHQARTSSTPLAAFASNDNCFRVLDINTETWLSQETHDFAPNCTALSPDGRLRVMVGDSLDVVITTAESKLSNGEPDILQRLSGHRDYGFACDWADDGWTIATAFQDKTVKIWDARRLTDTAGNATSVCTIRSEMAGVRSMRFSPIGSGKRVLVTAEEADFVNIIDAQTFRSKQTFDIFGELGGISFTNGGQDLMVLCCDRTRGGVLQLERCAQGEEEFRWSSDEEELGYGDQHDRRKGSTYDWPRSSFTEEKRVSESASRRRRKTAAHVELEPF
ncbi:WD40-repeat-containing domain protein [Chaetomidium leptoderma]|uniref:WD40-repeat-containing domain protein n=1 Tax=Chaetomidium leptoderma TaxID=669021 RepID=A0AAN6VNZ2_9PEZI|nr:WD40-repeat-containing domain protein [Chaetomidium leptoderma]